MAMNELIERIDSVIWGLPLTLLILGCGVFLTVRFGGVQFKRLFAALSLTVSKEQGGEGDISSFAALCTALSATIGTGNIIGVATAIAAGGPGALFWMEAAAIFGMATKYAEGFLAVKYRVSTPDGGKLGGPFYYIEKGMGKRFKPLACVFALNGLLVGLLGIGTFTQINGISAAVNVLFDGSHGRQLTVMGSSFPLVKVITGIVVTVLAGLVIIGGIRNISKVSSVIVPFMAVLYVACTLTIILSHADRLPAAIYEVVSGAFGLKAVGGAAAGRGVMLAVRNGVARGIFSNEAGLGSAPIAAAAAKTNDPVHQGLVTMTGTFIDTICICTMTGLAVIISGAWNDTSLEGVNITSAAFYFGLPLSERAAQAILTVCLVFFAFTTILGWSYYSERCLAYLLGRRYCAKAALVFDALYILAVFIGPYMTATQVWGIADILNALMALPNIIALIALSPIIAKETKAWHSKNNST